MVAIIVNVGAIVVLMEYDVKNVHIIITQADPSYPKRSRLSQSRCQVLADTNVDNGKAIGSSQVNIPTAKDEQKLVMFAHEKPSSDHNWLDYNCYN